MTLEIMSRDLQYSGKPGRSFRKSKEDLALFEHLPDSGDLDSCLADVEPNGLAGDQLLEKDVSDSDTNKNEDDWLVPAPEVSLSPQSHPSNLIISRNLSAIKTTRSATLEPSRVSTPQRNPSPRVYKGPQESKISPSRIPRFNASTSDITVRKSSPGPTSIPRASSSPRTSTPSAIPRASSSPRTSSSTSGIRPPSPKSKWTTSSKPTPQTPIKSTPAASQTPGKSTLAARGSSSKFTRASTTSPSTSKGRKLSSSYGSTRTSPASSSVTNLPSQPGSARSVKSVVSQKETVSTAKAAKPSFAYEFLSETPDNLRTDPFTKRARSSSGSLHVRSLSRSYDGPSYSGSNSGSPNKFQDYISKSQDREPSDLSRSQDRGVFQYSGSKGLTSDGRVSNFDEDFPTKIPAYGGVGRRTLKKDDDLLQSSYLSLGRETTLYQHDKSTAEDYSFIMGRSSILDPSCSTGDTAQAQRSLFNSNFGFKPFMTNSSIPSFSQHRKLYDPEFEAPQPLSTTGSLNSCEDIRPVALKNRFGFGKLEGSNAGQKNTVKRTQMGFALKKEDVAVHTELPASALIDTKASNMEMAIPHLSTTAVISHVEDKGPVKVYQGLGDIEDIEDMGGNWCCGMADQYRDLCKQHECVIFKNFHNALVLNNTSPEFTQPCPSTSSQGSLNEKSPGSESDEEAPERQRKENKSACLPIDSTPILEFLQQLSPNDHAPNCSSHTEAGDRSLAQRSSSSASSSCANSDLSANFGIEVHEKERRVHGKETTFWKLKSPEDTPPVENKTRWSKLEKGDSAGKKNGYNKWDLDIIETSSRPRQLGKPPDFFDVTKRNEDGGIIAAISSVKSLSASESGDDNRQRLNGKIISTWSTSSSEPLNRSASMNGSHVSHSDSEDEEELDQTRAARAFSPESDVDLARSDSEGETVKSKTSNYLEESDYNGASAQSGHPPSESPDDNSLREFVSEFSRASSTKSDVRRLFNTSVTSIDLTRSIDTTCSTQSPYEYNIWEEQSDSGGRYGDPMSSSNFRPAPRKSSMHMEIQEPVKVEGACSSDIKAQAANYDYGLEKLAGYIRSASVNARKRRASMTSSESGSKISLSRESSFDYFVDFFETETNLDPEARAVTDLLVSAHIEAKRVEFSPGISNNLKRMSSLLSSSSLRSDKSVDVKANCKQESWESIKSMQSLEKAGEGTEQIVESATTHASLDNHFSSFKFGQKKYPAGEFESITTLEVVPECPPSDSGLSHSRRRYSKRFNEIVANTIPEPLPLVQKFLKEIEEQQRLCEGIALSALKSAPLEPVLTKSVEQVTGCPKEEEGLQATPASPASPASPLVSICENPRISSGNDFADSCNELQLVAAVQTKKLEVEVDVEKEKKKLKEKEKANVAPEEEPDSQIEIEKAMVEQVLLPPVPNQMSKGPRDAPVRSPMRMTSTSPTKRANGNEVGDNDKPCGCTIL